MNTEKPPFVILIPVFNDWQCLRKLLQELDRVFHENGVEEADILIVDDGSTVPADEFCLGATEVGVFKVLRHVDILQLRRNLGHQRAIAIGLAYIEDKVPCQGVVVMDSDGEDDPRDVLRLIRKCEEESGKKIVFAERTKRSETLLFRIFYILYKFLYYLLTGRMVRIGNFSAIPSAILPSVVAISEMWNHYAAAIIKSRLPLATIPTQRAKRLEGKSKMNFVNLVIHGLSAISIYGETVGVRLLIATSVLMLAALAGLATVVSVRLFTNLAIPGWATFTSGLLFIVLLQAIMFAFLFSFIILSARQGTTFLPYRDYPYFVGGLKEMYNRLPGLQTVRTSQPAKVPTQRPAKW